MSDISILITGGGGAASEAINRILSKQYNLHFADADVDSIPVSISKERRHSIPYANESNFLDSVHNLCVNNNIDILVPSVDEELLLLQKNSKMNNSIKIMLPDYEYIEVMLDKLESMKFLEDLGIAVPKTVPLNEAETIGFPCIAKPRKGRGSRGVFTLNKKEDLSAYTNLTGFDSDNAVAQEKIFGKEFTVTVVTDEFKNLHSIVPIYVDVKRGITIRAKVDEEQAIIDACQSIHNVAPAKATYNIQLMLTEEGKVLPFEINPRISTTISLVLANGLNPFAVFLGEEETSLPYLGDRLQRYWVNEFSKSY